MLVVFGPALLTVIGTILVMLFVPTRFRRRPAAASVST